MLSFPNNGTNLSVRKRFENLFRDFYLKYQNINFDSINSKIILKHM